MAKNSEFIGEYVVTLNDNNSVSVSRIYKSTMAALTEIAKANGIEVQKTWTTQHLGCSFPNSVTEKRREQSENTPSKGRTTTELM